MKPNQVHDVLDQCENNFFNKWWNHQLVLPGLCGMIAFPTTIGLFHHILWKRLHIAAHSPYSGFCGLITVCVSSYASNYSVKKCFSLQYDLISQKDVWIGTFISVAQFFILAQSFRVVLPSHLLHVGAFAKQGILLKPKLHYPPVTQSQRHKIQELGYRYGCHTCGKRYLKVVNKVKNSYFMNVFTKPPYIKVDYVGDHQPPKALVNRLNKDAIVESFLFPQCKPCSWKQASRVRMANNSLENASNTLVTHSFRFRFWKVFVPWLLVLDVDSIFSSFFDFLQSALSVVK